MSYEYRLVFDDPSRMRNVMRSLKSSDSFVEVEERGIFLKDQLLRSSAKYDARLILENDSSMWLEVNFKAVGLYELIIIALEGGVVRCYEDGDWGNEVGLKEIFRIKS